ncbi:MAG: TonB family protein [Pseudomonadota bacterium]
MYHSEHSSFIIAAVMSITVHATAVVYLGHYDAPFTDQPQSTVSLMQISLAPARPVAPKPEPDPPLKPPPPEKEPAPKPEVKREPLPEPVIEPPPASTDVPETAELTEEQITASEYVEAPVDKPALARVVLENEQETYLLRLLAHIDKHKFYPRIARQRGTEGEIQVAFYLHKDGNISDLQITGGSKALRKAAKQAVQRALSLPPPPESIPLQEKIRFGMVYRLDG